MEARQRIAVAVLTVSMAGFGAWKAHEGFTAEPVIPTKGDVPTVGHGSTRYEDGTPVRLTDPPITPERAQVLALNLMKKDAQKLASSLPGAKLYQEEFDQYLDFMGQYGYGNWSGSTMRKRILAGDHKGACQALLRYRFAAGYDCSTRINGKPNKRCWGVWTRQLQRHTACMEAQ